jgi:hypothetical protein
MSESLMSDDFRARLARAPGTSRRQERCAARVRISETYDDITVAKARGVTWQTIAQLLDEDGMTATDGTPLTGAKVSAMYASERTARGLRKKRRTKAGKPQVQVSEAQTAPAAPTRPAAQRPRPKFSGGVKLPGRNQPQDERRK